MFRFEDSCELAFPLGRLPLVAVGLMIAPYSNSDGAETPPAGEGR